MGETSQTKPESVLELTAQGATAEGLFTFEESPLPNKQSAGHDVLRLAGGAIDRTPAQSDASLLAEQRPQSSLREIFPHHPKVPEEAAGFARAIGGWLQVCRQDGAPVGDTRSSRQDFDLAA